LNDTRPAAASPQKLKRRGRIKELLLEAVFLIWFHMGGYNDIKKTRKVVNTDKI